MKTLIIILFTLGFTTGLHFNFNPSGIFTPSEVVKYFNKDFAEAKEVHWDRSSTYLTATFFINGVQVKAFYSLDGELIGTAKKIGISTVPENVRDYLNSRQVKYTNAEVYAYIDEDPFDNLYLPRTRNTPALYCVRLHYPDKQKDVTATFTPNRKAYNISIAGL